MVSFPIAGFFLFSKSLFFWSLQRGLASVGRVAIVPELLRVLCSVSGFLSRGCDVVPHSAMRGGSPEALGGIEAFL